VREVAEQGTDRLADEGRDRDRSDLLCQVGKLMLRPSSAGPELPPQVFRLVGFMGG
jgi:hypothetical protein